MSMMVAECLNRLTSRKSVGLLDSSISIIRQAIEQCEVDLTRDFQYIHSCGCNTFGLWVTRI